MIIENSVMRKICFIFLSILPILTMVTLFGCSEDSGSSAPSSDDVSIESSTSDSSSSGVKNDVEFDDIHSDMKISSSEQEKSSSSSCEQQSSSSEKSESLTAVESSSSYVDVVSSSSDHSESSSSDVSSSSIQYSSSIDIVDPSEVLKGAMIDDRNGRIYKTVKIGNQVWMAENLYFPVLGFACYEEKSVNCETYGDLYTWSNAKKACPSGWHLPTKAEFSTLINSVGGESVAGKKLKSLNGWDNDGNGTDDYGFSALPGGSLGEDGFEGIFKHASFWTATTTASNQYHVSLSFGAGTEKSSFYNDLWTQLNSVRCIQNISSSSSQSSSSSMKTVVDPSDVVVGSLKDDRDGQIYKTVKIGNQEWMAENLNFAYIGVRYEYAGCMDDSTSWCYDNEPSNCEKYGRLYTWSAAIDSLALKNDEEHPRVCGIGKECVLPAIVRGVCPYGWHLPSKAEFVTLINSVGGDGAGVDGIKLKSLNGWENDGNGTDDYGFSVLASGRRGDNGKFVDIGISTEFWTISGASYDNGKYDVFAPKFLYNEDYTTLYTEFKSGAVAVRCLKDLE